jgi:hypothetical protein
MASPKPELGCSISDQTVCSYFVALSGAILDTIQHGNDFSHIKSSLPL